MKRRPVFMPRAVSASCFLPFFSRFFSNLLFFLQNQYFRSSLVRHAERFFFLEIMTKLVVWCCSQDMLACQAKAASNTLHSNIGIRSCVLRGSASTSSCVLLISTKGIHVLTPFFTFSWQFLLMLTFSLLFSLYMGIKPPRHFHEGIYHHLNIQRITLPSREEEQGNNEGSGALGLTDGRRRMAAVASPVYSIFKDFWILHFLSSLYFLLGKHKRNKGEEHVRQPR